jgi:hypothetical protein
MSDAAWHNVAVFYANDTWEYVREGVSAKEAVEAAKIHTTTVGAQIGMVVRVIITDDDDFTNFEWKFGEGVTYPTAEMWEAGQ